MWSCQNCKFGVCDEGYSRKAPDSDDDAISHKSGASQKSGGKASPPKFPRHLNLNKVCEDGHPLLPYTAMRAYQCNRCEQKMLAGQPTRACRACNWYACLACTGDADTWPGKGGSSPSAMRDAA